MKSTNAPSRVSAVIFQIAILAACLCAASCSKREAATEPDETVSATPPPAATPPPKPEVAIATPPPKRLAPDGVFFLLRAKSVETPDGIVGLKPGTAVVQQPDGKFVADGHTLDLLPTDMTNDLDIAGRVVGTDARAQATIRQALQTRPAPLTASGNSTATKSAPASTTSQPAVVQSGGTMLDSNSALGKAHTRVEGGWVYEKDAKGNWVKARLAR